MTRDSALLMSGERVADLNLLLVGPGAESERLLNEAVDTARKRRLPLLAAFTPHVARDLGSAAARLGLAPGGVLPMMVLRPTAPFKPSGGYKIERVSTRRATIIGDLQARAFDIPRKSIARVFDASRTASSVVETFIGSAGGRPNSTLTVIRTGVSAGIWMMATDPVHQREGSGRALLTEVLEQYRRAGVRRFYLNATAAGHSLYDSVGFKVLAEYSLFVLAQPVPRRPAREKHRGKD